MKTRAEIRLRFTVPAPTRKKLRADLARGGDAIERTSMATLHLDTEGRHLARAGFEWRLRREGRRWIQKLKATQGGGHGGYEHEVLRSRAEFDVFAHAGTPIGQRFMAVLNEARHEEAEVGVRSQSEVRRTVRRVRTAGASVEVIVDQGRMVLDQVSRPICNIEFRLVSGSVSAMLGLVERWRRRYALLYDPRSEAEYGDQLASNTNFPPLRKACPPGYPHDATSVEAFGRILDECLAHMTRNVVGLCGGDPALRVEHVHQLRVGMRRLRSALRSFRAWTPDPPPDLVDRLRALFATLGQARDADVLSGGVMADLKRIGAPAPTVPNKNDAPDPAESVRSDEAQRLLLAWLSWRLTLAEQGAPPPERRAAHRPDPDVPPATVQSVPAEDSAEQPSATAESGNEPNLRRRAARRLRRWHDAIVAAWTNFDNLDPTGLHVLRKRIKRQRYAVEFFAPLLTPRDTRRYLKPLAAIQERMGELNDLFVAQERYQALVPNEPTAWFALGWLVARVEVVRSLAKPELGKLAEEAPPA
jgi:inorganic triphosphatase YgiF